MAINRALIAIFFGINLQNQNKLIIFANKIMNKINFLNY